MNRFAFATTCRKGAVLAAWLCAAAGAQAAPTQTLAAYPLFLAPPTTPNVLVLFDNSGSMDATMSGKVISGDDPSTRGNIARSVLQNIITDNRAAFNWGLGTFELSGAPALFNTQAYFIGSNAGMIYTNNCTVPVGSKADTTGYSTDGPQTVTSAAGVTPITYKNNCVQNPDVDAVTGAPRNGMRYLTFENSGDDADINDVFYSSSTDLYAFGFGVISPTGSPNRYNIYRKRDATTAWTSANFSSTDCVFCPVAFTPTDAGWLPVAAAQPRMLFIKRGWGYGNGITGRGRIVEPVVSSATGTPAQVTAEAAHYNALMAALAFETNTNSTEIKNAAFSTPLVGTVKTARDYFAGNLTGGLKSPISQTCQKNYVVLATDGNPTGKLDGTQYQPSQWLNTRNGSVWTFGQAQLDVFDQIGTFGGSGAPTGGLRATQLSGTNLTNAALAGRTFDIQTYIVGLGDTVINESSVASLNQMAQLGGGYPTAFLGSSAQAVQDAFQTIVSSIQKKQGGSSSVAVSSSSLSSSTAVYQATFNSSDWSGDLKAFGLNSSGALLVNPLWSAADQLKTQDWDAGRTLLTYKPSAALGVRGIKFRWPANAAAPTALELDPAQIAALNTNATGTVDNQGALRLQYLRGDKSREAARCASCTPKFRDRSTPLGDLINSTPVLLGAPSSLYYDDIETAAYSSFAAAKRTRTPTLYVGGNDGMLHAFNAANGRELMAYVPSAVVAGLPALTAQGYQHRYFVDGTPTVGDVFYASSWKTLLVSGMRSGAKGVFALDVTDPGAFTEANASGVARWEFLNSQDADMGFVYSQPVIAKTNNGRWSVIVANGYNAGGSGHAVLFVLDAETGAVVKKIDTGAGSTGSPNGLSGPAVIDTNNDGLADVVYAGDLNGNLWKFDLSTSSATGWGVGNGGVALYKTYAADTTPDANAGLHAITSRPNVTQFPQGGYMVVFGTGSYLSVADTSSTTQQALYGIWDNLATGTNAITVPQSALVQQTVIRTATGADGLLYRLSSHVVSNPVDTPVTGDAALTLAQYYSTRRGWYLNLPTSGERSVSDSRIRGGRAIFTTLIPNVSDPCAYGGSGWLMELDVMTGNRDDRGTFDTNNSGVIDSNDLLPAVSGAGGNVGSGRFFEGGIPTTPTTVTKPPTANDPREKPPACTEIRYVPKSDGTTEPVTVACGKSASGRALWRDAR